MIDYYTAKTLDGNSRKVSIMLAEAGLEHVVHFLDLVASDQREPWFTAINPNGRIPAIVDHDVAGGLMLGESGAILLYLAEKCGQFLASEEPLRSRTLQWLCWQVGGVGPIFGQLQYFARNAPQPVPFAIDRYREEGARLMRVLEGQLAGREYVAGPYSIADMALYPWIRPAFAAFELWKPATAPALIEIPRWLATMASRPAVAAAMSRYEGTALRIARDIGPASA